MSKNNVLLLLRLTFVAFRKHGFLGSSSMVAFLFCDEAQKRELRSEVVSVTSRARFSLESPTQDP